MKLLHSLFIAAALIFAPPFVGAADRRGLVPPKLWDGDFSPESELFLQGHELLDKRLVKYLDVTIVINIAAQSVLSPKPLIDLVFYTGFLHGRKMHADQYADLQALYVQLITEETTPNLIHNLEFLDGIIEGCEHHQLKLCHPEKSVRDGFLGAKFEEKPCTAFKTAYHKTVGAGADLPTEQTIYAGLVQSQSPLLINFTLLAFLRGLIVQQDKALGKTRRTQTAALSFFHENRLEVDPTSTCGRLLKKLTAQSAAAQKPADKPTATEALTKEALDALVAEIDGTGSKPPAASSKPKKKKKKKPADKPTATEALTKEALDALAAEIDGTGSKPPAASSKPKKKKKKQPAHTSNTGLTEEPSLETLLPTDEKPALAVLVPAPNVFASPSSSTTATTGHSSSDDEPEFVPSMPALEPLEREATRRSEQPPVETDLASDATTGTPGEGIVIAAADYSEFTDTGRAYAEHFFIAYVAPYPPHNPLCTFFYNLCFSKLSALPTTNHAEFYYKKAALDHLSARQRHHVSQDPIHHPVIFINPTNSYKDGQFAGCTVFKKLVELHPLGAHWGGSRFAFYYTTLTQIITREYHAAAATRDMLNLRYYEGFYAGLEDANQRAQRDSLEGFARNFKIPTTFMRK